MPLAFFNTGWSGASSTGFWNLMSRTHISVSPYRKRMLLFSNSASGTPL